MARTDAITLLTLGVTSLTPHFLNWHPSVSPHELLRGIRFSGAVTFADSNAQE
jgi:hypothetical protein